MVFFIILNSSIFSQLLAYSGASSGMLRFATSFDVSTVVVLLIMFAASAINFGHVHGTPVSMILSIHTDLLPFARRQLGMQNAAVWFALVRAESA